MIVGVLAGRASAADARRAIRIGADLIEIRADLLAGGPRRAGGLLRRVRRDGIPLILTIRDAKEGGRGPSDRLRLALYRSLIPFTDWVDVECRSRIAPAVVKRARAAGVGVILSHHDFSGVPIRSALRTVVRKAAALGADIVKIAAFARTRAEVRRLENGVADPGAAVNVPVAAIPMGPHAAWGRARGFRNGSPLMYGHAGFPTAPGQPSLRSLSRLPAARPPYPVLAWRNNRRRV